MSVPHLFCWNLDEYINVFAYLTQNLLLLFSVIPNTSSLTHPFTGEISVESLLYAGTVSRKWIFNNKQDRGKIPAFTDNTS